MAVRFSVNQQVRAEIAGVIREGIVVALDGSGVVVELLEDDETVHALEGVSVRLRAGDAFGALEVPGTIAAVLPGEWPRLRVTAVGEPILRQRREAFRHPVTVPVSFGVARAKVLAPTADGVHDARTTDLSCGGLAFHTLLPLEPGDTLRLNVGLAPPLQAQGRVAHAGVVGRWRHVGVAFVGLAPPEQDRLLRYRPAS